MEMASEYLHDLVLEAVRSRYGGGEPYGKNNQRLVKLPDGQRALIKVGSNGQCMQRAKGSEIDAPFTGGLDQVDRILIAVRTGGDQPIRVYDVPRDVYEDQMRSSYDETIKVHRNQPSDLRVLRFDQKGYPSQRVASEWSEFLVQEFDHLHRGNFERVNRQATSTAPSEPHIYGPKEAIEAAKKLVAEAWGVATDNVSITVTM
jgi:hypothetical protein